MNLKYENIKVISCSDWDKFIQSVYGRPYCFQQQDGCKDRGTFSFRVPIHGAEQEPPETINTTPYYIEEFPSGFSLKQWLSRDPDTPLDGQMYPHELEIWWRRYFYPFFEELVQDLSEKGILEDGEYMIDIDW